VRTDDSGRFEIQGVPTGRQALLVIGYVSRARKALDIPEQAGPTVDMADIYLQTTKEASKER